MLTLDELALRVGENVEAGMRVPLLVLHLPEFAQIAWRAGRRSAQCAERRAATVFRKAARRIVRAGDALGHDAGSDRFLVAMLAPARAGHPPGSREVRSALERIAAAISLETGRRVETGWWPVASRAEAEAFAKTVEAALGRGTRERERGAMLATVGHELRTPLTSIRGYIETLMEGDLDPATTRRFLETARREALRLGRLVEGMLEFSMLDLSMPQRGARCDAVEQVRAAIDAVTPLAQERRMTIRDRLPPSAYTRIDGDTCVHALVNLAENAIKYGRDGGVVEISCVRDEPFVTIAVDDDGPGIVPGEREAIFSMGIRGGTACRPGTGIGLAIVKAIAERAGGDVRACSSSLGGASFVVRLPAG